MRMLLVAAAGVLVALALWQAGPRPATDAGRAPAPPPRAVPSVPAPASDATPVDAGRPAAAAPNGDLPPRIARRIEEALDRHLAATGLDARVTSADRAALRDALFDVRRASLRARRRGRDGAWQAAQTAALVRADRVFRATIGTGVADFLADAGPQDRVEDLGRRPPS